LFWRPWWHTGRGILQKQDANSRRWSLEDTVFHLAEFHDRFSLCVEQIKQVVVRKLPRGDIADEREQIGAIGIKLNLQPRWSAITFESGGARSVAISVGELPTADHALGRFTERRRRLRKGGVREAGDSGKNDSKTRHI
jgi:hypothetical protein